MRRCLGGSACLPLAIACAACSGSGADSSSIPPDTDAGPDGAGGQATQDATQGDVEPDGSQEAAPPDDAAPPGDLVEHVVAPKTTDPAIDKWNDDHFAYVGKSGPKKGKLVVFLPGSLAHPKAYRLFVQTAARAGWHAVALQYPNDWIVASLCQGDPDPDCWENIRLETLDGVDRTAKVDVSPTHSILNRLAKLLAWLDGQFPQEGWGAFLDAGKPKWAAIAVSGHSQGGGHAGVAAKQFVVARVAFLSSPADGAGNAPAKWVGAPHATPADRYFGLVHLYESPRDQVLADWTAIGMGAFGSPVTVEAAAPPWSGTHQLVTKAEPKTGGWTNAHAATAADFATPAGQDGKPALEPAWLYLLGP